VTPVSFQLLDLIASTTNIIGVIMSALADAPSPAHTHQAPSQRLRTTMAAARLSFTWFGVRKSLTPAQKALAAESFGAEGEYLSAGKKLIDTKHPAFRAVTAIRGRVQSVWRGMTLPYPEPGIRLLRRDQIERFDAMMTDLRAELVDQVANLDAHFAELKSAARNRLGQLFNPADYPESLLGLFGMEWEFPAIEPPSYLQQLSPELYEQERQRVAARFDEAVRLAEQAFAEELSRLVVHLSERLSGAEDGKPKVFRDSAINNLSEFFERFRSLNVRSNEDLDNLVAQAQRVVRGVAPQALRDDGSLRQRVAGQLANVQASLDGLMVDRPRRRILREAASEETP
jgi:hypothetical protein